MMQKLLLQFTILFLTGVIFMVVDGGKTNRNIQIQNSDPKETNKPGPKFFICGDTFIQVWRFVCAEKAKLGRKRPKRSAGDFVKLKKTDLVSAKNALSFLKPHRQKRQVVVGGLDNASEECCVESCSLDEVSEYPC